MEAAARSFSEAAALEEGPSLFTPATALMHAESVLRTWGCGNASDAAGLAQHAIALAGGDVAAGSSPEVERARDLVAVTAMCGLSGGGGGGGGGYDGAIASLLPWVSHDDASEKAAAAEGAGRMGLGERLEERACERLLEACRRLRAADPPGVGAEGAGGERGERAEGGQKIAARTPAWSVAGCAQVVCGVCNPHSPPNPPPLHTHTHAHTDWGRWRMCAGCLRRTSRLRPQPNE